MVKIIRQGVYYMEGRLVKENEAFMTSDKKEVATGNTITHRILCAHDAGTEELELKPDAVLLYDQTDVLRTLDFLEIKKFPVPVFLFEGLFDGTFLRSAAKKWGGVYIPENLGAANAYLCEQAAKSGQLLFASDGLTCGALGAMALCINEGDLLRLFTQGRAREPRRELLAVCLKGKLCKGVGPTDVALAVLQALEKAGGYAHGKYLEFFGAGVANLSMDYRTALDNALGSAGISSSVWMTDGKTKEYFENHLRAEDFKPLAPIQPAYYDGAIVVDLSEIEPMIGAGKIMTVREFLQNPISEYTRDGRAFLRAAAVEYGSATYETMAEMAEILHDKRMGGETACSWLQYSKSVTLALAENGYLGVLLRAGLDFNEFLSSGVCGQDADFSRDCALRLDARTIAASLANGGYLTSALGLDYPKRFKKYKFDPAPYESRVINYLGKGQSGAVLAYDDEIKPLPEFPPLPEKLELLVGGEVGDLAVLIDDPEEYAWSQAVADRERGAKAALCKNFPEKLRTHLIDWGILPLTYEKFDFKEGDVLRLDGIREAIKSGEEKFICPVNGKRRSKPVALTLGTLTDEERSCLLAGGKNNVLRGKQSGAHA